MARFNADIEVWNAAVLRCNEEPVSAAGDDVLAQLYRGVYEQTVRDALARHKWSFANKTAQLGYAGETSNTPKYAYSQPNDLVLLHRVTLNGIRVPDIELRGGKILSNYKSDDLYAHYTHLPAVDLWAPDFMEALVMRLEGLIRRAIHNDLNEGAALENRARALFDEAMTRDRNAQAHPSLSPNAPLVDAWRGGRRAPL